MPLRQLARSQWQEYFDRISRAIGARHVDVEVTGLGLADRIGADWVALTGLSYDPKDEVLIVFAGGLQQRIRPVRVDIDHEFDWLHGIDAVDAEGNHCIVQLKEPLNLPPP
jgi:hypothetical protein